VRHAALVLAGLALAPTAALAQIADNELVYLHGGNGAVAASLDPAFTMVRVGVGSTLQGTVANIGRVRSANRKVMLPITNFHWGGLTGSNHCPDAPTILAEQGLPNNPLTNFEDDLQHIAKIYGAGAISAFFYNLEFRKKPLTGYHETCGWSDDPMTADEFASTFTTLLKAYKEIIENSAFSNAELWVYSTWPNNGTEKGKYGVDWYGLSHDAHPIDGGITLNVLSITTPDYENHDNLAKSRSNNLKTIFPSGVKFAFSLHAYIPDEWAYWQHEPLVKQTIRNHFHCSENKGALFHWFQPSFPGAANVFDWTTDVVGETHSNGLCQDDGY